VAYNGRMARRKKVIGTAVFLIGALGLGLGFTTWKAQKEYQEILGELRALGAATNGRELTEMGMKLGQSDDSFDKAIAAYRETPGADQYAMNIRGWVAANGPSEAKRAQQALMNVIPLVRRAADSPRLDTGVWRREPDLSDSKLYAVKAFAGIMAGESKLACLRGDYKAALAALDAANSISVLTSENPTQLEALLAIGCQGMHWAAGNDYLIQFSEDIDALQAFEKYFASRRQVQPIAYSLKGELGYMLDGFDQPGAVSEAIKRSRAQSGMPPKAEEKVIEAFMGLPSVRATAKRKIATQFRDALTILRDESETHLQLEKLTALDSEMDSDKSLSGKVANLLWDGFETPFGVSIRSLANGRILRVSANCLAQRARSGKLPAELPTLGQDSLDPFTGKPLLYIIEGDSFKVYSVGQNLVDDGGLRDRSADIVFEFVPKGQKMIAATAH
jgi:tetratricopeptide (TPR) repeat protein